MFSMFTNIMTTIIYHDNKTQHIIPRIRLHFQPNGALNSALFFFFFFFFFFWGGGGVPVSDEMASQIFFKEIELWSIKTNRYFLQPCKNNLFTFFFRAQSFHHWQFSATNRINSDFYHTVCCVLICRCVMTCVIKVESNIHVVLPRNTYLLNENTHARQQ